VDPAGRRNEKIPKYLAEKQLQANVDQALARNPALLDNEELRKLHIASISPAVMRSF